MADQFDRVPSEEGRRRWPNTDGYVQVDDDGVDANKIACTCVATCSRPWCSGRCGCEACKLEFAIMLDESGVSGPDGYTITEEEGRERFGPLWPEP